MVAVVLILPLKGKLWLPWKTADQKRIEFRVFFFLFPHHGNVFVMLFLEEGMGKVPCTDPGGGVESSTDYPKKDVWLCA